MHVKWVAFRGETKHTSTNWDANFPTCSNVYFQGMEDGKFSSLHAFTVSEGIRRKTKIIEIYDTTEFRMPVVLHSKQPVTENIVMNKYAYEQMCFKIFCMIVLL